MPITAEKLRYRQINEYLSIVIFQLLHTSQKIVRGDVKITKKRRIANRSELLVIPSI